MSTPRLPPGQRWAAAGKWPLVGERAPAPGPEAWSVSITGLVGQPRWWSLDDLRRRPQTERAIDVHCVTRWSLADVRFTGVPLAELLDECDVRPEARFVSFVARSEREHSTSLLLDEARALGTMVALSAGGVALDIEHGGPVRTVVPGRYFYKSLKWLARIELLAADRLGYWEAEAGYHNEADPWREQRFMAPTLSRAEMAAVLTTRDFAGRDLRSLDAAGHDLSGLNAQQAWLRDANFRGAKLVGARFDGANLSNAHFGGADLRGASFVGADVEGADFCGADLRGCDLRGTSQLGSSFAPTDEERRWGVRDAIIDETTRFDRGWGGKSPEARATF